tara:strand:+ start:1819 stop:2061 length:243 start_codon:yes stop_codon:yes gene_type:complete
MKHINLQGKISKYLIENGPKDTKEIQQFCATLSNKKSGSKSNLMFNQPINVISNIMRRKYFVKVGHNKKHRVDIWNVKEE